MYIRLSALLTIAPKSTAEDSSDWIGGSPWKLNSTLVDICLRFRSVWSPWRDRDGSGVPMKEVREEIRGFAMDKICRWGRRESISASHEWRERDDENIFDVVLLSVLANLTYAGGSSTARCHIRYEKRVFLSLS